MMSETNHTAKGGAAQGNKMGTMAVPSLLVNMSIPLMFSLLIQSLYNIVDSIFVAKISESALTATSLAYPVQILMVAGAVGTGVGVSALLSRLVGSKNYDQANICATTGLVLTVLTSLIFIILGIVGVEFFVGLFTDDAETAGMCVIYLRICMIFCTGTFLETLAQRLLQAVGNTFLSMVSLVAGAGTNIILDPILIFGLLGFPAMGIRGAAIATVIGQWVGAIVALLLNLYKNKDVHFVFRGYKLDTKMAAQIYKVGVPTMVMQAMGSIMNASMNAILIGFSSTAVAFFGVYFKLQNFLFMPMNGLGQAVLPIVGFNYGSKNRDRLNQVLKIALPAAVVIGLIGTAIFCLLPAQLLSLFSASDDMLALGVPALRIISVTFALGAATMVLGYYASGLGNGVINMLGNALRQFLILIPVVFLLAKTLGINYVWYAFWVSEAVALIVTVILFGNTYRKKTKEM